MPDRRPVIALVTDAIGPYHRGGKEQRYSELSRRLAEHAEVHVYTMNWWQGAPVRHEGGVTYHALSPLRPLYSGDRRSIRQAALFALCCFRLLTKRFDVIEADHMPYMQLFPLRLVAWLRRKRLVVTWHECWGPEYWRDYLGLSGRIGWALERTAMRLPDGIIAASPQTAERLREFIGTRVPITVAPNGIDLEAVDRADASPDPVDVVVVGRLLPHKRIDLLLDALAILREEYRPVTAFVIGSGPQLDALRAQGRALGIADSLSFRQDVGDQQHLYGVLKSARTAVFPSEREGFGIAVLEALACGIPVITTSAPANYAQHLITPENDGHVCEPTARALADAIATVLDRADVRRPAVTTWLEQYDWASVATSVARALS